MQRISQAGFLFFVGQIFHHEHGQLWVHPPFHQVGTFEPVGLKNRLFVSQSHQFSGFQVAWPIQFLKCFDVLLKSPLCLTDVFVAAEKIVLFQFPRTHLLGLNDDVFCQGLSKDFREQIGRCHLGSLCYFHQRSHKRTGLCCENFVIESQLSKGKPNCPSLHQGKNGFLRFHNGFGQGLQDIGHGLGHCFGVHGGQLLQHEVVQVISTGEIAFGSLQDYVLDFVHLVGLGDEIHKGEVHVEGKSIHYLWPIEGYQGLILLMDLKQHIVLFFASCGSQIFNGLLGGAQIHCIDMAIDMRSYNNRQSIRWMHYFKSVVKNVYQKVIQDEYLQNLTEHEVYLIINSTRKRLASHGRDPRKLSANELEAELLSKVEDISNLSPERLFRIFGSDPGIEMVAAKNRELNESLEQISELMQASFPKYESKMNQAIAQIDNLKSLHKARLQAIELRSKIKGLEQASMKSKKIAHLNIKAKNIKMVLKILAEVPRIKKMSLTELKSINMEAMRNKPTLRSLHCLKGLSTFVDRAVSAQLSSVLEKLKECLVVRFNETEYENALKDFIIAQHETIKYEVLFVKIIENKIMHSDTQFQSKVRQICDSFIELMTNLHEVYRWHRENEKQEKWQHLCNGYYGVSIEVDLTRANKTIVKTIDETLKDIVMPKFYQHKSMSQFLQNLYFICRMSQIVFRFSGLYLTTTIKNATQFVYKKLLKTKEKASHELEETFRYEQRNYWNRLPVVNDYSHEPIDKTMYQIHRHLLSGDYSKAMAAINHSKTMLKDIHVETINPGELKGREYFHTDLWSSTWMVNRELLVIREINETKPQNNESATNKKLQLFSNPEPLLPSKNEEQSTHRQQLEENWQIEPVEFPWADKYEKNKAQVRLRMGPKSSAIICQYSLTILKYMEALMESCFYYPIEPVLSFGMGTICLMLQHFIYQIFNGFLSNNLKLIFFENTANLSSLEQRYHKKRLHYQYPNVSNFIFSFKAVNKLTIRETPEQQNQPIKHSHSLGSPGAAHSEGSGKENIIVRSRVVALESLAYLIQYYQHICRLAGLIAEEGPREPEREPKKEEDWQDSTATQSSKSMLRERKTVAKLHPQLAEKVAYKIQLYRCLYAQLSELIYTDCIPKMCVLQATYSLIESIKWGQDQASINEYRDVFAKTCLDFYFKMSSSNRGEVPAHICDRLYGIFWKTQLTAIMKAFMNSYRPGKSSPMANNAKNKLENFIDGLYESISVVVADKTYLRGPFEKIKAVFPILMEKSWQTAFQMLKLSLMRHQFVFAVSMGLFLTSESCSYLGTEEIEERRRKVQKWIQQEIIQQLKESEPNSAKK